VWPGPLMNQDSAYDEPQFTKCAVGPRCDRLDDSGPIDESGRQKCLAQSGDDINPVLSHGLPRPRFLPCHSTSDPWHLAPILSERPGQVKPEDSYRVPHMSS